MARRFLSIALAALWLCAPAGARSPSEADLVVVPDRIDFGMWPAGKSVSADVYLINTGSTAVTTEARLVSDDPRLLASPPAPPITLGPGEIRAITLTLNVPLEQERVHAGRARVETPLGPRTIDYRVKSVRPDLFLAPPSSVVGTAVRGAPAVIELGDAGPGAVRDGILWLINTDTRSHRIVDIKPSCGCLQFPEFAPFELAPGRAARVNVKMFAKNDIGQEQYKHATVLFDGLDPVWIPVRMFIVDPRIERVLQGWTRANAADGPSPRAFQAVESPVWIGDRAGPGIPRAAGGRSPFLEWRRATGARLRTEDVRLAGDVVVGEIVETSDFLAALGIAEHRYAVTWWLDAEGFVDATVFEATIFAPDDPKFARFIERLSPERAAALAAVPPRVTAAEWSAWVDEWRADPASRP